MIAFTDEKNHFQEKNENVGNHDEEIQYQKDQMILKFHDWALHQLTMQLNYKLQHLAPNIINC